MTARDLLTPWFFFRRRALIAFLIPVLIAVAAAALAPKTYLADTRLLILLGDDYAFHSALSGPQPNLSFDRTQIVKAETEIMGSRELVLKTVKSLGPQKLYPHSAGLSVEAAAERLRKDLTIDNIPQSNVVDLRLRNGDPKLAAMALNTLVQLYLKTRSSVFEQNNQVSVDHQAQTMVGQLAVAEAALSAFATDHHIADYQLELTGETNLQMQLQSQLEALDRQLADVGGRGATLERQKTGMPERTELSADFNRPVALEAMEQTLSGLQGQRREAVQQYLDSSPLVRDLDERIVKLQSQIAGAQKQQQSSAREGLNPIWQEINLRLEASKADLAGFRRARSAAQTQLSLVDHRLQELIAIGPEYRALVRTRDLLETTGSDLAKRSQEARLETALSRTQTNVRILQPARAPLQGESARLMMVTVGLAAGAASALAVVLFSAALFPGFLTPQDVEQKLATPVLLTVGDGPAPPGRQPALEGASPAFLTLDDAKLIDQLIAQLGSRTNPVVQWIGPEGGAGVTSLLVDYAILASGAGRRVLLIDTLPGPGHGIAAKLKHCGGALEAVGEHGQLSRVVNSSLFLTRLKAGRALTMKEVDWRRTLAAMCDRFDLVLIDAPPLSRAHVGLLTAGCVDATLVVIEAEATRARAARNLIDRIAAAGGVVTAAIFNKRRFYLPKPIYEAL